MALNLIRENLDPKETKARMARICMIAYSHYTNDPRIRREAEALASRGDHVDCICLPPIVMRDTKVLNGVHINPLNIDRYQGASSRSYLLSYLRFMFRASLKVTREHIARRYDVVQVHTMPDFMVFSALLPKLLGAKVILDVHDLVPELYMYKFNLSQTHLIVKVLMWIEVISIRFADKAISVHKMHLDALVSHGNNANRFEIVLNVPDPTVFKFRPRESKDDHFNIVYHGTVSKRHGIELAVRAAMLALPKIPNLRFSIIGGGDNLVHVKQLVRDLGLEECVRFLPLVPVDKLPFLLGCADVGVVPLLPDVFTEFMLPLKLMEYVALGVPCIATRTRTIEAYFDDNMVQFISGRDEAELSECLVRLYQYPRQRERLASRALYFNQLHNWDQEKLIYFRLIDSLVH